MARYIDAKTAAETIAQKHIPLSALVDTFADIPSADVVEVKHGKWKKSNNKRTCSICSFEYFACKGYFNYCPECGAKMDGKEDTK